MSHTLPPQTAAWITLDRVQSLMSRQIQAAMTAKGVTRPQYSVLRLLLEEGAQTANALSDQMGVTPGNLTGVIDRLESAGLVLRARDDTDRRRIHLSLTPAGTKKAQAMIPSVRGLVAGLFAALDDQQLTSFQRNLDQLAAALDFQQSVAEESGPKAVAS